MSKKENNIFPNDSRSDFDSWTEGGEGRVILMSFCWMCSLKLGKKSEGIDWSYFIDLIFL